jgi:hypothetical protein
LTFSDTGSLFLGRFWPKVGALPLKNTFAKILPRFFLAEKVCDLQAFILKKPLPRFFAKTFL